MAGYRRNGTDSAISPLVTTRTYEKRVETVQLFLIWHKKFFLKQANTQQAVHDKQNICW